MKILVLGGAGDMARDALDELDRETGDLAITLSLIHISEPTRPY